MADDTGSDNQNLGTVIVLIPDAADPAAQGVEDAHVTLAYLGDGVEDDNLDDVRDLLEQVAGQHEPFQMDVSGAGYLGPDKARVLLLESEQLKQVRDSIMGSSAHQAAAESGDGKEYPFYIPHMTLSYEGDLPQEYPDTVSGSGLGLWVNGTKETWDLTGGALSERNLDVVVPINSLADLDLGIRVAAAHPGGRWYVAKRACALGMEHRLPADWGAA